MELICKKMTEKAKDIAILEEINNEAFPDDERVELQRMFQICEQTNGEVLGFYEGDVLIGYAMMHENDACAYLNFFAIKKSERCKGYGQKVLKAIQDRYVSLQLIIDFEILDPKAENYEMRKRRKAFYLRCGMQETGYCTKLSDNYFELVCNHGKLNVQAAGDLMKQVHAKMPELGDRLYHYEQKTGVRL